MARDTASRSSRLALPLLIFSVLAAALLLYSALREPAVQQPNILFIVLDDLGVNDLGSADPAVTTPNLDAFAAQGTYYSRHYTDATCSVTRVGILTGQPPAVHGFRTTARGLSPEVETLPDGLRRAGYATHHVGKWHIGHASRLAWPTAQGFDGFFGFLDQHFLRAPSTAGQWTLAKPGYRNPWLMRNDQDPEQHQGHLTDLLTAEAIAYLDSRRDSEQPWFLNVWMYAPHAPLEPQPAVAARYPDSDQGRYLAMLESADAAVGRILAALEASGQADNTLVLVASDNGGTAAHRNSNAPLAGKKGSFAEGGVRAPLLARWPGTLPPGQVINEVVTYLDYLPTLLALAGEEVPEALPGRNFLDAPALARPLPQPMFWEASSDYYQGWGVLSQDKRWRLVADMFKRPMLYDLEADPAGSIDVMAAQGAVAGALNDAYLEWRQRARRVPLDYEVLPRGGAQLTGNSLQRVPGFDGHTIGVAAQFAAVTAQPVEYLLYQADQWQLTREGGQLRLRMNGMSLDTPAPADAGCHSLIVSSLFHEAHLRKGNDRSQVNLFIDGELAAADREERFILQPDAFLAPTYVGRNDAGEGLFAGRLGVPVVLNEHLLADSAGSRAIGRSVAALHGELCPAANP